jgi:NTE family protein
MRSADLEWSVLNRINLEEIDTLVIIVVDARNEISPEFDTSPKAPGVGSVISTIATTPLDNYSFDTVELLREVLRTRADAQRQQPELHQVGLYPIYVGFDQLQDESERTRFLGMETSFTLPADQVDDLRRVGGVLLESSSCFQALLAGSGDAVSGCGY